MSLLVALIRQSADQTLVTPVEKPPFSPVEERLVKLLPTIRQVVADPSSAAKTDPNIDLRAATSPWDRTRHDRYFEPLLRCAILRAIAQEANGIPSDHGEAFPLVPNGSIPSTWNPVTEAWDPIRGASIAMIVGPSFSPTEDGSDDRWLNDPETRAAPTSSGAPASLDIGEPAPNGVIYVFCLYDDTDVHGPIRECTFEVADGPAEGVETLEGVAILFANTRTRVLSVAEPVAAVELSNPERSTALETDGVWILPWNTPRESVIRSAVVVRYLGDPPVIRSRSFLSRQALPLETFVPAAPGHAIPLPPEFVRPDESKRLSEYRLEYKVEIQHREALIRTSANHKQEKLYFLELDRTTNPLGLEGDHKDKVVHLGGYLAARYMRRSERRQSGQPPVTAGAYSGFLPMPEVEQRTWRARIIDVADLLASQLKMYFPAVGGGIDFAAAGRAYELFGTGKLAVLDTHGVPNGLNVFCFVELALACLELKHEPELWAPMLRCYGVTAELYVRCFRACDSRNTYCAYRIENNPLGGRAPEEGQLLEIRAAWLGPNPTERYEQLLQSALVEDLPGDDDQAAKRFPSIGCH